MERPHQPLPVLGAWCCGVREPGSQGWRGWLGTATPGAARSLGPAPNQPHPEEERRRPGDLSGHLLAYLSLSPIFVIIGFVTLIIFKRELHTISFLGGLALNEGVNWLIKHVIQEPRPCGGPHAAVGTKYGMPSSHSQFMWFFSVYSFLFLYLRMHQTNNARFLDLLWRHLLSLGLLTAAFLVSYSRPISEFFLIRDTSLIPNVLWFEYTVTRAEARNRQRKLGTKLQ
ncbi:dolichyldiphosphatase 1 isoform X3 [Oryctolagus cuniculus]|uniref:dolichyldiphosphatase 1 isoform X3 n=1 Tax=Oryctolagus cuniculus TaxID=9986 RepID=UPI00222E350E|nr:dolichyldiphosphatase 1 isoform X3 [Oryctolagus cuniculus]